MEYVIAKKNEYSRKLKEYERLKKKEEEETLEKSASEMNKKIKNFLNSENNIVSKPFSSGTTNEPSTSASISNMSGGKDKELPSFWVPSKTPSAEKPKFEKPVTAQIIFSLKQMIYSFYFQDSTIYCPISQRPLKVKDLIDVKFTPIKDPNEKKSIHVRENRYMCAVTHDALSNSVPCAVLRPR